MPIHNGSDHHTIKKNLTVEGTTTLAATTATVLSVSSRATLTGDGTGVSGSWWKTALTGMLLWGVAGSAGTCFTFVNDAGTTVLDLLSGKLIMRMYGRFARKKGANIAAANNLTLGGDGNVFIITGNTQINGVLTTDWQAGSDVSLIFTGTPTVKHNTGGTAGFAATLLAGSADLAAANNTVLTLIYDGTNWQEKCRKTP